MALVAFWLRCVSLPSLPPPSDPGFRSYGIRQHLDLSSSVTWRIPFAIQIIPGGLLLVGACFLRESPRYLLKRHRPEEATRNLCWLRKLEPSHTYIEEELSATVIQINREKAVAADFKGNAATRYCRGLWHEATTPGIRNRLVIGFLIMAAQSALFGALLAFDASLTLVPQTCPALTASTTTPRRSSLPSASPTLRSTPASTA